MRLEQRIPIFLDKIEWDKYIDYIQPDLSVDKKSDLSDNIIKHLDIVERYWLQYPDLRISQVLINTGIIPNFPGVWYYEEDEEVLINSGCAEARDIMFWGINYTKDMERLPETKYVLIKDLKTDHIQAILDGGYGSPRYREEFTKELQFRLIQKMTE